MLRGVTPLDWQYDEDWGRITYPRGQICEVFTTDADARFIAWAREAVPALSARLAEAQALVYAARQERDAAEDQEKELAEELRTVKRRLAADAKAHEKEIAVWSENYAALERRLAEVEALARGQEEQLEIQGNTLIRVNEYSYKQSARAEAAEAENVKLREALRFYADLSHDGPWHLPGEDYGKQARAEAAEAENATLQTALIWCSGSDDFQDGGKAREGWLKLCAPLIAHPTRRHQGRQDMTYTEAEVQAMVAAAVMAAAKVASAYCWNRYASKDEGGQLSSPAVFTSHTHQDIEATIRATIRPDAKAALEAHTALEVANAIARRQVVMTRKITLKETRHE
jgi:hypothetical protein